MCIVVLQRDSSHLFRKYALFSLEGIICHLLVTLLFHFSSSDFLFETKTSSVPGRFFFVEKEDHFSNTPALSNTPMHMYSYHRTINPTLETSLQHSMSYSRPSHPSKGRTYLSSCKAKRLLLRDIRPIPQSQNQNLLRKSDLCSHQCIYCDIWKLALLVYSRVPHAASSSPSTPRTNISPQQFSRYTLSPECEHERGLKTIEAAYHQQRARLSSIISICTVEGAEESEGLRAAHDRCLAAVFELIRQERSMDARREERQVREWTQQQEQQQQQQQYQHQQQQWERDYGYGARRVSESKRGSVVSCAM